MVLKHLDTLKLPEKKTSEMSMEEYQFFVSGERLREALTLNKIRVFLFELNKEVFLRGDTLASEFVLEETVVGRVARTAFADLLQEVDCPVCFDVKKDFTVTCRNRHSFCSKCISDWQKQSSPHSQLLCPLCREPLANAWRGEVTPLLSFLENRVTAKFTKLNQGRVNALKDALAAEDLKPEITREQTILARLMTFLARAALKANQ